MMQDQSIIVRNSKKRRARTVLADLWANIPEAFFLCAIAITLDKFYSFKSTIYLNTVSTWWLR